MTDSLSEPPLSKREAERRLPTLDLIEDPTIRAETRELSRFAPAYFWERPGSVRGYHNAGRHGLWTHTLKLSTVVERLADSSVNRNRIRPADVDRLHAAAILHDQRKEGQPSEGRTVDDHDLRMGHVVRESSLGESVARLVEEHMGAWGDGPDPASQLSEILHTADMIASDDTITIAVQEPIPDELRAAGVEGVDLA